MGTGMQRLKEKHANKKANTVRMDLILSQLENENAAETKQKEEKPKAKRAKISKFSVIPPLTEVEQAYFDEYWELLKEKHEEPEKYRASVINLARICAMSRKLEERIEQDGGAVLEDEKGKIYTHPAAKLLIANNAQVLLHLKALGMTVSPRIEKKKQEEPAFTSEFAQFN